MIKGMSISTVHRRGYRRKAINRLVIGGRSGKSAEHEPIAAPEIESPNRGPAPAGGQQPGRPGFRRESDHHRHAAGLQGGLEPLRRLVRAHGFIPVPTAPETIGAYLVSLADSHAPSTIRRRLAAIGKLHRYNDLP